MIVKSGSSRGGTCQCTHRWTPHLESSTRPETIVWTTLGRSLFSVVEEPGKSNEFLDGWDGERWGTRRGIVGFQRTDSRYKPFNLTTPVISLWWYDSRLLRVWSDDTYGRVL